MGLLLQRPSLRHPPLHERNAFMTANRRFWARFGLFLCQATVLMGAAAISLWVPPAHAGETPFKNLADRLEKLHEQAARARDKRDFVVMEDLRLKRQQILEEASKAPAFERPADFSKRPPAEQLALEEEEAAYTRLIPWIEGHKAIERAEHRTRKMRYAAAAQLLRDFWQRAYPKVEDMHSDALILGDVGVALFRTCQAASFVHPDFVSREGRSGYRLAEGDEAPAAGLDEAELKSILRACRLHDPCQVEVNLMLAFLERLTNDNAFLRAENRPELETRNKLLLDLAGSGGSTDTDSILQPRIEFLKAQSTLFILDELKFYDTFLQPARICVGNDHARRPFLVTETNDACLQVPTATALKPMLAVLEGGQWAASSLYYVRVRKTNGDGQPDSLWPLRDRDWPSSPAAINLTASLERVYEDYLLAQLSQRFSERFFTSIGRDLVKADRVREGIDHFREQTKAGQVPTVAELLTQQPSQTKPTRLGVYAVQMRAFVDQVDHAFRTVYLREHPEMQARVDTIMTDLNDNLKDIDAIKDRPQELTAAIGRLAIDPVQKLQEVFRLATEDPNRLNPFLNEQSIIIRGLVDPDVPYATRLSRLQQYHQVISTAVADITSERGVVDLQRKEMASRVQSLAAKTRQFAILQAVDFAAIAMAHAAGRAADATRPLRDEVDRLLRAKATETPDGRPLDEAELAFLRDFRRLVLPVDGLLREIQRDCELVHRKLSSAHDGGAVTLGAVEQTAQLLASIGHNLSQLAPSGLFDSVSFPPRDPPSPCQAIANRWSDGGRSWHSGCFQDAGELAAAMGVLESLRTELQIWIDADRARQQVDRYCSKFQGKRRTVETPLYTAEVIPVTFPYQFGELRDAFQHLPRLHLSQGAELRRLLEGKTPLGSDAVDFERTYLSRLQASNISNIFVRAFDAKTQQWVVATVNSPTNVDVLFLLAVPASPGDRTWFDACIDDFAGASLTVNTWLGDRPARVADGSLLVDFDGLQGLIPWSETGGDRYGRNRHWQSIRRVPAEAIGRDALGLIASSGRFFDLVTQDRGATVTDRAVVYNRADWQQLDANATNDFLPSMQSLAPSLPGAELLRGANSRPIPTDGFRWLPICPPYAVGSP